MTNSARISVHQGATEPRMLWIGAGVVLVVIVAVTLLLRSGSEPEPAPPATAPDIATEAERGDAAREIIAAMQTRPETAGPVTAEIEPAPDAASGEEAADAGNDVEDEMENLDYDQAYARARAFQAEGRLADAQLLYFFAARGGHSAAAFDLATFYDPVHFSSAASLMDEPDPFQAYKWYKQSLGLGNELAGVRLSDLRVWVEKEAESGNMKAEQLLLIWE